MFFQTGAGRLSRAGAAELESRRFTVPAVEVGLRGAGHAGKARGGGEGACLGVVRWGGGVVLCCVRAVRLQPLQHGGGTNACQSLSGRVGRRNPSVGSQLQEWTSSESESYGLFLRLERNPLPASEAKIE